MKSTSTCTSGFQAALLGAAFSFTAALAYAFLFVIVSAVRVATHILAVASESTAGTLAATSAGIFISSIFIALLLGTLAAAIQAVTLVIQYYLTPLLNREHSPMRGAAIGFAASALLALALQLLFRSGPDILVRIFWQYSYPFWIGLPTLIYLSISTWLGWKLRFGPQVTAKSTTAKAQQPAAA